MHHPGALLRSRALAAVPKKSRSVAVPCSSSMSAKFANASSRGAGALGTAVKRRAGAASSCAAAVPGARSVRGPMWKQAKQAPIRSQLQYGYNIAMLEPNNSPSSLSSTSSSPSLSSSPSSSTSSSASSSSSSSSSPSSSSSASSSSLFVRVHCQTHKIQMKSCRRAQSPCAMCFKDNPNASHLNYHGAAAAAPHARSGAVQALLSTGSSSGSSRGCSSWL